MHERPESRQPIPEHARRVFEGVLFDVYQWEQELFDGSVATFEKLKRNDSALVIPVLENGKLLITEDEQPGRKPVITFPGGQGEKGETPEALVRRELLEETGYEAGVLELLSATQPATKIEWAIFAFVARDCRKVAEPALDPGERITLREITFDELLVLADDPRFQNRELSLSLMRARYDREARQELERKLFGTS